MNCKRAVVWFISLNQTLWTYKYFVLGQLNVDIKINAWLHPDSFFSKKILFKLFADVTIAIAIKIIHYRQNVHGIVNQRPIKLI
jgi:hypothetical protein